VLVRYAGSRDGFHIIDLLRGKVDVAHLVEILFIRNAMITCLGYEERNITLGRGEGRGAWGMCWFGWHPMISLPPCGIKQDMLESIALW